MWRSSNNDEYVAQDSVSDYMCNETIDGLVWLDADLDKMKGHTYDKAYDFTNFYSTVLYGSLRG